MVAIPQTIMEKTKAALLGDNEALGTVFQWYSPRLKAHALRICGNNPLVKDALQETFISAFLNYHSLRDHFLFYPWLKKILINHCYRLLQKEKKIVTGEEIEKNDVVILQSIEENIERSAERQRIYEALKGLSDELRSCVLLRYFSSFKRYEEIAEILDIPVGTVRSRLSAAREKLLVCYNSYNDPGDKAIKESELWTDYYYRLWSRIYNDGEFRKEFMEHLDPTLQIRFTSGKKAVGRKLLENEMYEDLHYGTFLNINEIASSGNISVIDGHTNNPPEYPDRCPPSTVLVMFRENGKVNTLHLYYSKRLREL